MDDKIDRTAMTRMPNLRNILELVNDGSFPQQQFVRQGYEMVLHVFAQPSDEMEPLFKKQLCQGSGNVAAISEQLAAQSFHHLGNRSPIIHIARRKPSSQQVALIIDGQVEYEAVKPSHACFATPSIGDKDTMLTPFGITDFQRTDAAQSRA